jgi:Ca2+-binding RTX toxin-like protein
LITADASGTDTVESSVTYSLATATTIENIILSGSAGNAATGNALANTLTGNSGANVLTGGAGNDIYFGGAGADTLTELATDVNNDKFTGGTGKDTVTTGGGSDTIIFAAGVTDTVAAANGAASTIAALAGVDLYNDLLLNADVSDKIDLSVVVANVNSTVSGAVDFSTLISGTNSLNALLNVDGGAGFDTDTAGDISAAIVTTTGGTLGAHTFLAVDLNGSGTFTATDFLIEITGSSSAGLTVDTFI